ncbi:MAG TPA: tRNA 2-selenouridine(34) synthase MnmH [Sphingobacteriaceae bacterium]
MITTLPIEDFIVKAAEIPVVDVRTPAEFDQGHMTDAHNIPLFSNEERVQVGTTYKQQSRESAILLGFDLTGPKWAGFIRSALEIAPDKRIGVHCWRGGMRSGAMAWALNLYGFEVYLLEGGYKKYRNWVLNTFSKELSILILGGMTGSGKTKVLKHLQDQGEQVIDLEDLARHQGSSYGTLGYLVQPTQEQFENDLAHAMNHTDPDRRLWLEDESLTIGKRMIPKPLWLQMRNARVLNMNIPAEERIRALAEEYGRLDPEFLVECTERIRKRLGPEQTRDAVLAIRENRMADFVRLVLVYYDKTYRTGQSSRDKEKTFELNCQTNDPQLNAGEVLRLVQQLEPQHI